MANNKIKAGILAMTVLLTTPVQASDYQQRCEAGATLTYKIGQLRDKGYTPDLVFEGLIDNGVPENTALSLLTLVYIDASYLSALELAEGFYATCLKLEQTY